MQQTDLGVLTRVIAEYQNTLDRRNTEIAALRSQLAEKQEPTGPTEAPASPAGALGTEAAT